MGEVKWIKLSTNFPDHRKIKKIRRMPQGNDVVLFWVFLLVEAGRSNESGGLYFMENMPYTEEDLASEFDFTIEHVQYSLGILERMQMIVRIEGTIFIKNWEEYQALDKLQKMQEQNRLRQKKYREQQKMKALSAPEAENNQNIPDNSSENNATVTLRERDDVTLHNAVDIDKELDIDIDIDKDKQQREEEPFVVDDESPIVVSNVFAFYDENFSGWITPHIKDILDDWLNTFPEDVVQRALEISVERNKNQNINYANKILSDWDKRNIRTLEDVDEAQRRFESERQQKQPNYNRSGKQEVMPEWWGDEEAATKAPESAETPDADVAKLLAEFNAKKKKG
jgi:predicted phage replisome organizer